MQIAYARFELFALLWRREQQTLRIPVFRQPYSSQLGQAGEAPAEGRTLHHSSPPAALSPPFC